MTEPWIRVHANIASRPLIGRAMLALKVHENEAIGLMVRFWGGVSQHVVNGDLTAVPDSTIEEWAGWKRKHGMFAAFVRNSHLDPDGRPREWDDYAGKLEQRREKDRTRKEEERARKSRGQPQDVTRDSIPTRANETTTIRDETETPVVVGAPETRSTGNGGIVGVVIGQPAEYALALTIAANNAVTARWGEQIHPYLHGNSYDLVQSLREASVALETAKESIGAQVEKSGRDQPPSSINWFRPGILTFHAEQTQRAIQAENPAQPPDTFGLRRWAKETNNA